MVLYIGVEMSDTS